MSENKELTDGQKLVGYNFNPGKIPEVDEAKKTFADLIDKILEKKTYSYNDNLVRGNAIQSLIQAQMAVVKVLTWNFETKSE